MCRQSSDISASLYLSLSLAAYMENNMSPHTRVCFTLFPTRRVKKKQWWVIHSWRWFMGISIYCARWSTSNARRGSSSLIIARNCPKTALICASCRNKSAFWSYRSLIVSKALLFHRSNVSWSWIWPCSAARQDSDAALIDEKPVDPSAVGLVRRRSVCADACKRTELLLDRTELKLSEMTCLFWLCDMLLPIFKYEAIQFKSKWK